jgi:hypothetical protein
MNVGRYAPAFPQILPIGNLSTDHQTSVTFQMRDIDDLLLVVGWNVTDPSLDSGRKPVLSLLHWKITQYRRSRLGGANELYDLIDQPIDLAYT